VIIETLKVANRDDAIIRVFLSRGPGNFSVNPYDSVKSQFYVAITRLNSPAPEKYEQGVVIGKSSIPMKDSWMAQVKSCNYLPNVMMRKEAVDRNLDFVVGVDEEGFVTEGPTENIMIVDAKEHLVHPGFDNILKGTTMTRVCELARTNGIKAESRSFSLKELQTAQEIMMCGTTLDVLPVREFEGQKIGNGKPGPISIKLRELIREDLRAGPKRTPF
jgi:branched-chain amino acid aminotransferase